MASSFGKNDVQLWWTRRADDELWEGQRGWKKSVMMGDETVALASRPAAMPAVVNGIRQHDVKGKDKAVAVDGDPIQADEDPASRIIIIHPGARTTRIGRASDPTPVSVPTVVARSCRDASRRGFRTDTEPARDPEAREAYNGKIDALRADLRARMRTLKLRGTTNGQALAASYNAEVAPEALNEAQDPFQGQWTRPAGEDTFIGQAALSLANPAADGYTVRWPLKAGTFNTSAAAGYVSKSELLADIEAIWLHAITVHLGIPELALKVGALLWRRSHC